MILQKLSAGPSAPAHPTSKSTDHSWDTEIKMYAGVIGFAVHTAFRRGLAIAAAHARFNLTNKREKNAGRYTVRQDLPRGHFVSCISAGASQSGRAGRRWTELRGHRIDRIGEVVEPDPRGVAQQDVSTTAGAAGKDPEARWR